MMASADGTASRGSNDGPKSGGPTPAKITNEGPGESQLIHVRTTAAAPPFSGLSPFARKQGMSPLTQEVEQRHLREARVRRLRRLQAGVLLVELADRLRVVDVAQIGEQRLQVYGLAVACIGSGVDGRQP